MRKRKHPVSSEATGDELSCDVWLVNPTGSGGDRTFSQVNGTGSCGPVWDMGADAAIRPDRVELMEGEIYESLGTWHEVWTQVLTCQSPVPSQPTLWPPHSALPSPTPSPSSSPSFT